MINRARRKKRYLLKLQETGNKSQARRWADVASDETIKRWQQEDRVFARDCQQALDDAAAAIDAEIRRRGMEGVDELLVTPKGVVLGKDGNPVKQKKYSDSLLLAHAKAHLPHLYGDKHRVEMTGRDGGPVQVESPFERISARLLALREARVIEGRVDSEPLRIPAGERTADDPYGVADL
jgi:hypothetical protein